MLLGHFFFGGRSIMAHGQKEHIFLLHRASGGLWPMALWPMAYLSV